MAYTLWIDIAYTLNWKVLTWISKLPFIITSYIWILCNTAWLNISLLHKEFSRNTFWYFKQFIRNTQRWLHIYFHYNLQYQLYWYFENSGSRSRRNEWFSDFMYNLNVPSAKLHFAQPIYIFLHCREEENEKSHRQRLKYKITQETLASISCTDNSQQEFVVLYDGRVWNKELRDAVEAMKHVTCVCFRTK